MSEKKDVLDFPLEEVEVPQAIVLMMQAATKTVHHGMKHEDPLLTDDDRLQLLCEKLEARVEDAIDAAKGPVEMPEDEPEKFLDADRDSVVEVWENGEVKQLVHNGIIFGKFCNEPVYQHPDSDISTSCIKQWDHENPVHEDEFGNERAR